MSIRPYIDNKKLSIDGRMIPYPLVTAGDYLEARYSMTEQGVDYFKDNNYEQYTMLNTIIAMKQSYVLLRSTMYSDGSLSKDLYAHKNDMVAKYNETYDEPFDEDFYENYSKSLSSVVDHLRDVDWTDLKVPLDTIPTHDRFGLVEIRGTLYQIVDIGLRMLEPKELYGCQGFPQDYIIDHDYKGKNYPRSEQVKRCGNSVCPSLPAAMVRVNLPELCVAERTPNMRIEAEQTGQLRFA